VTSYLVSIDLGTTNTVLAYAAPGRPPVEPPADHQLGAPGEGAGTHTWRLPPIHEELFPWSGPYGVATSLEAFREDAALAGFEPDPSKAQVAVFRTSCGYMDEDSYSATTETQARLDGRAPDLAPEEMRLCSPVIPCIEWFFNVEPGPISVEVRLQWSEELVGRVHAYAWAGGLTHLVVGPTPLE